MNKCIDPHAKPLGRVRHVTLAFIEGEVSIGYPIVPNNRPLSPQFQAFIDAVNKVVERNYLERQI